jgi:hypothetical protein
MKNTELSKKILESTYSIFCYDHGELYSMGTAVAIHDDGTLLTAGHVITNGKELSEEEILKGDIVIFGRDSSGSIMLYRPILYNLSFILPGYFKEKIDLDIAVIKPIVQQNNTKCLAICKRKIDVGEDIIIGGYPDDVVFPEKILENLIPEKINGFTDIESLKKQVEVFNRFVIVKKCIVSKIFPFSMNGEFHGKKLNFEYDYFYFDSVLHQGASGGPVINENGELIGIVIERAIIKQYVDDYKEKIEIPSGMGIAISANLVLEFL